MPSERCMSGSARGRAKPLVARPEWRACPTQLYVWTAEGWLYLAAVLDLYSRAVIGWAMGTQLTGDLTQQALMMAIHHRAPPRRGCGTTRVGAASTPPRRTSNCSPRTA